MKYKLRMSKARTTWDRFSMKVCEVNDVTFCVAIVQKLFKNWRVKFPYGTM